MKQISKKKKRKEITSDYTDEDNKHSSKSSKKSRERTVDKSSKKASSTKKNKAHSRSKGKKKKDTDRQSEFKGKRSEIHGKNKKQKSSKKSSKKNKKQDKETATKFHNILNACIVILSILLIAASIFIGTRVRRAEVISGSMEPTLAVNEKVIVVKASSAKRFDIVVFYPPKSGGEKEQFVKRVIGIPGDRVEYKDDQLCVNGQVYEEKYLAKAKETFYQTHKQGEEFYTDNFTIQDIPGVKSGTETIPDKMYLVLGDNRNNSQDSRYIGLIPEENIVGVVWKK